ncbi:MAG: hypothetical protein PHF86_14715 [Candidatus Nanoarchaeia archaeon]|nr:hypothetical protein [Candidatus Nanoarchaeia archaeon]
MSYKQYLKEMFDMFQPSQNSAEDYIDYLEGTLIPDLREAGMDATADDFETVVEMLKNRARDVKFEIYLKDTLIPGLHESGRDATAEDFEEGLYWLDYVGQIKT